MVFTTILSFGTPNVNISPIDLLIGYPTNLILTWENRKKLDSKVYLPLIALVIIGSIPGVFMLKNVNTSIIKLIFGVVVIVLGCESIARIVANLLGYCWRLLELHQVYFVDCLE